MSEIVSELQRELYAAHRLDLGPASWTLNVEEYNALCGEVMFYQIARIKEQPDTFMGLPITVVRERVGNRLTVKRSTD